MNIKIKPPFRRDTRNIYNQRLKKALYDRIDQIRKAKSIDHIIGIKRLRSYSTQYRILVKSGKYSYRIGATIRGNTIWLVRFLPRKKIYREFP